MIVFDRVTHYISLKKPVILHDVSLTLPTDRRTALLGLRGSGRSTVIRLINGLATPRHGLISRPPHISYAVGGPLVSMSPKLTVMQNIQDLSRIYGVRFRDIIDFVVEWGDAEPLLRRPLSKLNPVERSRILYPLAYGLPFEYYVVDGDPAGPASQYRDRFLELFKRRIDETGVLCALPKVTNAAAYCDAGLILHQGQLVFFDALTEALAFYEQEIAPLDTKEDDVEPFQFDDRRRDEEAPESGVFF